MEERLYTYICPNCGEVAFFKDPNEIKVCNRCGHEAVSTVCFEE